MKFVLWGTFCLMIAGHAGAGPGAPAAGSAEDMHVEVDLDATEQAGRASATVRIHAPPEIVWSLITSCTEALRMVPGLVDCTVLDTAPDHSSQRIRHVLDYWFVKRLSYEIRATYERPSGVRIERVAGDLKELQVSWKLDRDGAYTDAHYQVLLAPGFWVPHWLVRVALRTDLPKMLRTLRTHAESAALQPG